MVHSVIKEKGLLRHLDEKVFIGKTEREIYDLIFPTAPTSDAQFGFLSKSSLGLYIGLCHPASLYEERWIKTGKIYRLRSGDVIGISAKDGLRTYVAKLNQRPELVLS